MLFFHCRGKDRCRHFVISCPRNGQYVVSGDTCTHQSLAELISYYQTAEIEPFGEHLTTACSKLEEKSIYDEISLDQQTSSKQSSADTALMLTRQASSSSSNIKPAKENNSNQPTNPRGKLQEQQKSLSKERQHLSQEDPDEAPPIPDRSRLLTSEQSEEDTGDEGNLVYSVLKKHHLDNRSLEVPIHMSKGYMDNSQKTEELVQASSSSSKTRTSAVFALAKQSERLCSKKLNLIEPPVPETIYSEISVDQGKSHRTLPESHSGPSSFTPSKKATLSSPTSTPPKLSPKLPNKPKASTELQGSQLPVTMYATSLVVVEEHRKPNQTKALPDLKKGTKSHPSTVSGCDDTTYEQIPFGWLKSITHKHDSEMLSKSSPMKPKETYDQISTKTGRSSKTQVYTENPYEKIPDHFSKGSASARHVPTAENTYEKISFGLAKGTEATPNQKSDKPRKFLFAEKKTKF
ncbi:SH2 domain-containing protein 7 [Elgaria multicarinata webbii]|uniref:SH2 domain-containing protein 7 n=1 Tax=Elgaria multicarinata webbii TaxID=159646 RepID=UPI002FCCD932